MRPLQLAIAACLGALLTLVIVARHDAAPAPPPPTVEIIDTNCYSCGSGSGPWASSLAAMLHVAADEIVLRIDRWTMYPEVIGAAELAEQIDTTMGRQRYHGQFLDVLLASPRGMRRAVLLLH